MALAAALVVLVATTPGAEAAETGLEWEQFEAFAYYEATRSGQPIVLQFSAEWCAPCAEMKERTFRDPDVMRAAEGFRLFIVDITARTHEIDWIKKSFKVIGAPTVIFYGSDGKERKRRGGFIGPEDFLALLAETRAEFPADDQRSKPHEEQADRI